MLIASILGALSHIVAESAPFLLFGFAAAGLLRAMVPERQVRRLLGQPGFRSVFLASLLGVPLPLCSCSVIPAATGLRRSGASRAATTSFLISTPETGVDSISITYALMDPLMTVVRPLAAFATALTTGALVSLLPAEPTPDEAVDGDASSPCCESSGCNTIDEAAPPSRLQQAKDGLRYAFGPLLDDLAPWLLVGFVLAAVIAVVVPESFFANLPSGWISSLLMMLIATPVYICASAATPIAAAMVFKGLDPGAALVFLLVGPATNVTTILVVLRFLGTKVLAIYIGGVTISALVFGFAVNAIYANLEIDPPAALTATDQARTTPIQTVAAVIFLGLLGYRLLRKISPGPNIRGDVAVSSRRVVGLAVVACLASASVSNGSPQMPTDPAEAMAIFESDVEKWGAGPVQYIFTRDEAQEWRKLEDDAERRDFIRWFWDRRDDDLRDAENPFKEGFYTRVGSANRRFSGFPRGWRSDRGRVWTILGRPDSMRTDISTGFDIWSYSTYGGILRSTSVMGEMQLAFVQVDPGRWEINGGNMGPGAWPAYLLRAFDIVNNAVIENPQLERKVPGGEPIS